MPPTEPLPDCDCVLRSNNVPSADHSIGCRRRVADIGEYRPAARSTATPDRDLRKALAEALCFHRPPEVPEGLDHMACNECQTIVRRTLAHPAVVAALAGSGPLPSHPDDGHPHSWGCRRCGVDPGPAALAGRGPEAGLRQTTTAYRNVHRLIEDYVPVKVREAVLAEIDAIGAALAATPTASPTEDRPMERDPGYPYGEMDAAKWAAEFVRLFPDADEGTMLGWFANAIMTGYDAATNASPTDRYLREVMGEAIKDLREGADEVALDGLLTAYAAVWAASPTATGEPQP